MHLVEVGKLCLLLVQLHDLLERWNLKEVRNFLKIGVKERSIGDFVFSVFGVGCILMLPTFSWENMVDSAVSGQKVSSHTHLISFMKKLKFKEVK